MCFYIIPCIPSVKPQEACDSPDVLGTKGRSGINCGVRCFHRVIRHTYRISSLETYRLSRDGVSQSPVLSYRSNGICSLDCYSLPSYALGSIVVGSLLSGFLTAGRPPRLSSRHSSYKTNSHRISGDPSTSALHVRQAICLRSSV